MRWTGRTTAVAVALAGTVLAGCGGGSGPGDHAASASARPMVYAASSLRAALPAIVPAARYSFGGSNALRLQIEHGAPADVMVGASPKDPERLAAEHRCGTPVAFATNELVLVVPAHARRHVTSLADVARGGLNVAVGGVGVPIGDYTRKLLATAHAARVLGANTVSNEQDVASILAKVRLGSADAGFVYVTDARLAKGAVRVIHLPKSSQPVVRYEACAVVRKGAETTAARAFLARLTSPKVQAALVAQGFGRAP